MVQAVADDGWQEAPPEVSTIAYKTQSAIASNGDLSNSGTFSWPETAGAGDLGVFVAFTEPNREPVASVGWSEIDSFVCSNGTGGGASCKVFAKVHSGSESSLVITAGVGTTFVVGQFFVYTGQAVDYLEAADGLSNQSGATTLNFKEVFSTFDNVRVLLVAIRAGLSFPWFGETRAEGNLSDWTETADSGWTVGVRRAALAIVRAELDSAGGTGAVTASSTMSDTYTTRAIVLK